MKSKLFIVISVACIFLFVNSSYSAVENYEQDIIEEPTEDEPINAPAVNEEIRKVHQKAGDNTTDIATNTTAIAAIATSQVIQIVSVMDGAVNTGTTAIPVDDTIPQITEGDEYMTLAITPTSATNKLKIEVVCHLTVTDGYGFCAALFETTTHATNALACGAEHAYASAGGVRLRAVSFTHHMTSPGTGTYTFRVRGGQDTGNTVTFNGVSGGRKYGGVLASSITITEYLP